MASERLYLCKDGDQEVYIDNNQLKQYQIEGIRFLYTQYKKKKNGVIFNDPSGGKRFQIVLFLNAINKLLKNPILIVTTEDKLNKWRDHFLKYSDCSNAIGSELTNPFASRRVFINSYATAGALRRSWGALVVDDLPLAHLHRLTHHADYKIWSTPLSMKENLYTFQAIYHWLYPEVRFDAEEYMSPAADTQARLVKAVLLDAFLEDVVIRRKHLPEKRSKPNIVEVTPPKVSKKNKDATGTKIKRSKRKVENDIPLSTPTTNQDNVSKNNNNYFAGVFDKQANISKDAEDAMDVEHFIKDEKPVPSDGFHELLKKYDGNSNSNDDIYEQNTEPLCETKDGRVAVLDNDSNNDVNNQSPNLLNIDNDEHSNSDLNLQYSDDTELNETENKQETDETNSQSVNNIDEITNNDTIENVLRKNSETNGDDKEVIKNNGDNIKISNDQSQSIEAKLAALEKETLNKYKGSYLDRIF